MSDQPYRPASPVPYSQADPQRVGMIRQEPFEHFCAVCGAYGSFGFGGDLTNPGIWACTAHKGEVEKRWKRG